MRKLDQEIKTQLMAVGLEGIGDAKLPSLITRIMKPKLFTRMLGRVNEMFKQDAKHGLTYPTANPLRAKTKTYLNDNGYVTVGDLTAYIPPGLDCTYLEYIEVLEAAAPKVTSVIDDLLVPTRNMFGILLNNPSIMASASGSLGKTIDTPLASFQVNEFAEPIGAKLRGKNNTDEELWKHVVKRNGDYDDAIKRCGQLHDALSRVSPPMVEKAVKELLEDAQRLSVAIQEDPLYADVSKAVSNMIAEKLYHVACWVEFYAVYVQQVRILNQALTDTTTKFDKIAK